MIIHSAGEGDEGQRRAHNPSVRKMRALRYTDSQKGKAKIEGGEREREREEKRTLLLGSHGPDLSGRSHGLNSRGHPSCGPGEDRARLRGKHG
jgi:hypothetical protein